ncbi:MAG TPA: RidA family protein [Dehalococcoidia bacterium]
MDRCAVNPPAVVAPKDRYSQAVRVTLAGADLLFITGQQAWDRDGRLVGPGDMTAQSAHVFGLVRAIVEAAGGTLADVVKVTCFVTDLRRWPEAAAVRNRCFPDPPPASTVVQVSGMTDPGALIEVEAIAVIPHR